MKGTHEFWGVIIRSINSANKISGPNFNQKSSVTMPFFCNEALIRNSVVSFYHVMYAFQSESTLYSYLNVKKLLALSRREIWSLSDCNWTRTQNHLVCKRTLNHLAKLTLQWLSCVLSTYLYGAFGCIFLSCHVPVSEWIHTL